MYCLLNAVRKNNCDSEILPRVSQLTSEQELILEKNIVWIFGSRRSGTTWLRDMLAVDSKFVRESYVTEHLAVSSKANIFSRLLDDFKNNRNYFFSEYFKETWSYYLGKLLLYRIYAEVQDYKQKIFVKEPSSYLDASDIILQCFPNSKAIIILRDGRDVIDSIIDGRQNGGWLLQSPEHAIKKEDRIQFIEQTSTWWLAQTKIFLKIHDTFSNRVKLIKYEELLSDTLSVLKMIYSFIDKPATEKTLLQIIEKFSFKNIPDDMKGKGKFYRSATPGKWKENFNDDEKHVINRILGSTLKELGYE